MMLVRFQLSYVRSLYYFPFFILNKIEKYFGIKVVLLYFVLGATFYFELK